MKKVVYCYYVHKSNQKEIEQVFTKQGKDLLLLAQSKLEEWGYSYDIIKYNKKDDSITLIHAIGWDKLYEPIVGESYKFSYPVPGELKISYKPINKKVYHQKHTFVAPDYTGFDIEESKRRTELLETLSLVKNFKNRIGNIEYWNEVRNHYNLPAFMPRKEKEDN